MSARDSSAAALASVASIPRNADGPVFPTPWTARAFALAVALNENGVFTWGEWAEMLGAEIAGSDEPDATDPESNWRAWLATLETMLKLKRVADNCELVALQEAWRHAAESTPHGEPIEIRSIRLL